MEVGTFKSNFCFYLGGITQSSNLSIGYPVICSLLKNLLIVYGILAIVKSICSCVFPGAMAITKTSCPIPNPFLNSVLDSCTRTSVLNIKVNTLKQSLSSIYSRKCDLFCILLNIGTLKKELRILCTSKGRCNFRNCQVFLVVGRIDNR